MRYFVLSVSISDWERYHESFSHFRDRHQDAPYSISTVPKEVSQAMGMLLIIDWEQKSILARKPLPMPQGICVEERRLLVALRGTHELIVLEEERTQHLSHPRLANLHTISPMNNGRYLLTSSATDTIVEIDLNGELFWSWSSFDHGFTQLKNGHRYVFDPHKDHRELISVAADHPTHINSAIIMRSGEILATFFQQGLLVRISRSTGQLEVILDGLQYPHSIRASPDGFILSDSFNSRILRLDNDLRCVSEIKPDLQWIQDSQEVIINDSRRIFSLSNRYITHPSPSDRNRVVEVDVESGQIIDEMNFELKEHLFSLEFLTEKQALFWSHRWSREARQIKNKEQPS
jgi:hypothetical protein